MRTALDLQDVHRLLAGQHSNPDSLLGPHVVEHGGRKALAVRAFLPDVPRAWVVSGQGDRRPMRRIHPAGLFEALCADSQEAQRGDYQIEFALREGTHQTMHDPYAFPPLLSDYDLHLLNEGTHWHSYEKLGAHLRTVNGVSGVHFALWAPNATAVAIVGDFNDWDARKHPMRKHIPNGFWELFIPGIDDGTIYKFRIRHGHDEFEKSDPFGFAAELPPRTASKVVDLTRHQWADQQWMQHRAERNALDAPLSFYEVHLGSWMRDPGSPNRWLTYKELAPKLVDYVKRLGYTHVEFLPLHEHPLSASWGYQPVGLYAVTSRFGTPEEFMYLVDYLHQNQIGVLIDWVPAHFPRDGHGLRMFDGTHLYEHADPRQGEHRDWGTLIYNYGRHEVSNYLISNALFWLDKYHIDGLRVDAVASMLYLDYSREPGDWIPNEYGGNENLPAVSFIKEFNVQVHQHHPGTLTVAEESTAWGAVSRPTYLGGLGFSLKWNMGWMNDSLRYMRQEAIHRKYHHNDLTFSMIYAYTENFVLALSHDEVVHGKGSLLDQMPGDLWQKFANLRLMFSYMWAHPGKKLLFMGDDFGQWSEWNFEHSLQWHLLQWESHQGIQKLVSDLNKLYRNEPALHEIDFEPSGHEWIDCHSCDESVLAFIRKARDPRDFLLVVANFTPVPRMWHRCGVPEKCGYEEIFNSDSGHYAGSNVGNGPGRKMAEDVPYHGRPWSMDVTLPPLGIVIFKPKR